MYMYMYMYMYIYIYIYIYIYALFYIRHAVKVITTDKYLTLPLLHIPPLLLM